MIALVAGCPSSRAQLREAVAERQKEKTAQTARFRAGVFLKLAATQLEKGQLAEAEKSMAKALHWQPEDPAAYVLRSRLSVERGKLAAAVEDLQKAVSLDPDLAEAYYEMGLVQMRLEQPTAALESLRRAIDRDTSQPAYYLGLAAGLAASGRKTDSHRLLTEAAQRFSADSEIHEALGESFLMQGEDRRALESLKRSVALDATNLQARKSLAFCAYSLGEYEEALRRLRSLIDDEQVTETAQLRAAIGECLLRCGEPDQAAKELARAGQLDPHSARVRLLEGHCHALGGQWKRAVEAYSRAVEQDPRLTEARYSLGYAALRQGATDQALRHLRAAVKLAPDNPLVHRLMGKCYQKVSDTARAEEHFAKAAELGTKRDVAQPVETVLEAETVVR